MSRPSAYSPGGAGGEVRGSLPPAGTDLSGHQGWIRRGPSRAQACCGLPASCASTWRHALAATPHPACTSPHDGGELCAHLPGGQAGARAWTVPQEQHWESRSIAAAQRCHPAVPMSEGGLGSASCFSSAATAQTRSRASPSLHSVPSTSTRALWNLVPLEPQDLPPSAATPLQSAGEAVCSRARRSGKVAAEIPELMLPGPHGSPAPHLPPLG